MTHERSWAERPHPYIPACLPQPPTPAARTPAQRARLLALRACGQFYTRGTALPRPGRGDLAPDPPRALLLIRPDHLGDMLFLTPALAALRSALPQAHITLLTGPWGAEVVQTNTDLDEVVTCAFPGFERRPKTSPWAPYRLLGQTARLLRCERYDTAVVLRFDHWWGAWLAAAARIPQRIGYDWPETRPFLTAPIPYNPDRHEVEQNVAQLRGLAPAAGWQIGPTRYAVAPGDRAWAQEWLTQHGYTPDRPLVAIHPGAGAAVKQWPVESWVAVAGELVRRFAAQILLTGSAGEHGLTAAIASRIGGATPLLGVLDAAGETTLGRLAALQEQCALVLGSDCGPLHLAAALDVPTVHMYGPVSAHKFGPWGDPRRHVVLSSNCPCVPCNRLDWPASVLDQHRCMEAITVAQVLEAAKALCLACGL